MFLKIALILLCFSAHAEVITWRVDGKAPKHFESEINQAIGQWSLATNGAVEFVEVGKRENPMVRFIWDKKYKYVSSLQIGYAFQYGLESFGLFGYIAINPEHVRDRRILRTALLHEIGHIVGIWTHLEEESAVMHETIGWPKVVLTKYDIDAFSE